MQRETFNLFESSMLDAGNAKKVSETHPYFSYAHLLSLKNDPRDTDRLAKAGLFFSNHMQLHALLNPPEIHDDSHEILNQNETQYPAYSPIPDVSTNAATILNTEESNSHTATDPAVSEEESIQLNDVISNREDFVPDGYQQETEQSALEKSSDNADETKDHVSHYAPIPDLHAQKAAPDPETDLLLEPLHASDYFASQGIKLSEDMMGNDKLGKQLKSFTAWLKTMKKITPGQTGAATMPNAATEYAVQSLAEKSNADAEVLTEAMAEAYLVQDKKDKAAEIYEKLSLLNPAKSAYFASKIDSLK